MLVFDYYESKSVCSFEMSTRELESVNVNSQTLIIASKVVSKFRLFKMTMFL